MCNATNTTHFSKRNCLLSLGFFCLEVSERIITKLYYVTYEETTAYKPAIRYSSSYALLPERLPLLSSPFQIACLLPLLLSRDTSSPQYLIRF